MKSKLEALIEGANCKERESTSDGFEYCRGNISGCPYLDNDRFVTVLKGSYHPCKYFNAFDKFIGLESNKKEKKGEEK